MMMKKLLSLALVALMATSAWAEEVTFNFENRTGITAMGLTYKTSQVQLTDAFTHQGVTFTPLTDRIYIGYDDDEEYNFLLLNAATAAFGVQSFKLSVAEGYAIKAIHFKLDTPSQVNKLTFDSGEWVEEAQHYITNTSYETWCDWTGDAREIVVGTAGAGVVPGGSTQITYRLLIDQFTVTYGETNVTSVEATHASQPAHVVCYYNVSGQQSATPFKGVNIVRMSDGSARKVVKQ